MKLEITDEEYEVIVKWYDEWVKSCKLLATFAFSTIGIMVLAFSKFYMEVEFASDFIFWIKTSVSTLVAGGVLAFISGALAYVWLDMVHRIYKPSLKGKVLYTDGWMPFLKLGSTGWFVTVTSFVLILTGIVSLVRAVYMLL